MINNLTRSNMTEKLIQHIESHPSLMAAVKLVCDRVFFSDLDRSDAAFEIRGHIMQVMEWDPELWHSIRGVNFADVVEHFMYEFYENN